LLAPGLYLYKKKYMRLFSALLLIMLTATANAQSPAPAAKGVNYGAVTTAEGAITVNELGTKMANGSYNGKLSGKVTEVCMEKGCWMKLEKAGGESLMVKFKDYGFFMPKDIVGRNVVLDGEAVTKEVSVKQLKHYAADAGKSKEEIEQIKSPKKETQFVAKGVLVQ
jgi:Domain of unknown function (DUF4920)